MTEWNEKERWKKRKRGEERACPQFNAHIFTQEDV